MSEEKPIKELFLDDTKTSKQVSTWKLQLTEDKSSFIVNFGNFIKEDTVEVIGSVTIPIKILGLFTETILNFSYDTNSSLNLDMELFRNTVRQGKKIMEGMNK